MLPQNYLLSMFNDVRLHLKPSAFDKTPYDDMSSSFEKVIFIVIFALSSRLFQVRCLSTRTKSPCDSQSSNSPGGDCNDISSKETWIDNDCPRYQYAKHGICSDIIGNGRIYMNKASQVSVERKLNVTFQQLWTLISWMQDWTLDEVLQFADVTHKTLKPLQKQAAKNFVEHPKKMTECYEKARKTFCLYRFPACITYKSNSIASIRKEFLCREACLKLKQDICAEAYTLLSVFDQDIVQMYALDCNVLPSVLPKRNSSRCIQPAFLIPDSDPTAHTTAHSSVTTASKISTSQNGSSAKRTVIPTTKIRSMAISTAKTIPTTNGTLLTTGAGSPVHTAAHSSVPSLKTSTAKKESTKKGVAIITTKSPPSASSTTKSISTTNGTSQTTDQKQSNTLHSTSRSKVPSALQAKEDSKQSTSRNWMIYGLGSVVGVILCLALIGILYLRKRSRRTTSQTEEVQEEEPYHICPFDNAEEIGQLMRFAQGDESSDTESLEMRMPPPIPDSARPNLENITLLAEP